MHLISIRNLREEAENYPDIKKQIEDWHKTVKKAEWQSLNDVQKVYRDAEAVGNFTEVLNVKKSLIKIAQNMLNFGRRIKIF